MVLQVHNKKRKHLLFFITNINMLCKQWKALQNTGPDDDEPAKHIGTRASRV